jgi:hypothetical protein
VTTHTARNRPATQLITLFVVVVILLAAFGLRTVAIERLPQFGDEASHIIRAQDVLLNGELFTGLRDQKWLYTVVLALFAPTGPEATLVGRTLSALCALVTVASAVALGRLLGRRYRGALVGWGVGLTAAAIYALLPMAVFHERQALVDPMMSAFTGVATVLSVKLAERPRVGTAAFAGLMLGGAVMTKASALPFLAVPFAASVLLARRRDVLPALGLSALSAALAGVLIAGMYWAGAQDGVVPRESHTPSFDNTWLNALRDPTTLNRFEENYDDTEEAMQDYVGEAAILLAGLALVWLIAGQARREFLFLLVPAVSFMIIPLTYRQVTGHGYLPPRYYLPNAMPQIVLVSLSLFVAVSLVSRLEGGEVAAGAMWAAALMAIGLPALSFDAALIINPVDAPLTDVDRDQYIDQYETVASQQMAAYLLDRLRSGDWPAVTVVGPPFETRAVQAYLGPDLGRYHELTKRGAQMLIPALARGEPYFIIVNDDDYSQIEEFLGGTVETASVARFGSLDLRRVVRYEDPAAREIYETRGEDGEVAAEDIAALADALRSGPADAPVLVFPALYEAEIGAALDRPIVRIKPGIWPLTADNARPVVQALDLGAAGQPFDAVLIREWSTDERAGLRLALQGVAYRTGDESFHGPFHRMRFVTGPDDPAFAPLDVAYEGVIHLDSAALVDSTASPGGAIRLALRWQTDVPVADSFHVFAHLVDGSGELRAQHDGIPGDGLLPMTEWEPGAVVEDRFAVPLPPDLPPGTYELQVGVYNAENGLRLPASGANTGPGYAVIGTVTVEQPGA